MGSPTPEEPIVALPVIAYTSGTVAFIVEDDELGGKYIILKGNDNRYYYYAHNCALFVKKGQTVSVGEVIATTNRTGQNAAITPEHLHFAIGPSTLFPDGGGTVCPQTDFEDKFSLDRCSPVKQCAPT